MSTKMQSALSKTRKVLLGSNSRRGIITSLVTYIVLISLGFAYLLPLFNLIAQSIMTTQDIVDPMIVWVPTRIYFGHFIQAWNVLAFMEGLYLTVVMSVIPAILQTVATALAGYAFARYDFPLKRFWIIMLVLVYIIPTQVLMMPRFLMFLNFGIGILPPMPTFLPALFGQGLRSSIFVMIFYQFFHSYPKSLDEAAEIDGCNRFKLFWKIAVPMVKPAIVISLLFSIVWYWNETSMFGMFYGPARDISLLGVPIEGHFESLPLRIIRFQDRFEDIEGTAAQLLDSVTLAGTLLSMLPILILYLVLQRHFVESVERSGITGE